MHICLVTPNLMSAVFHGHERDREQESIHTIWQEEKSSGLFRLCAVNSTNILLEAPHTQARSQRTWTERDSTPYPTKIAHDKCMALSKNILRSIWPEVEDWTPEW